MAKKVGVAIMGIFVVLVVIFNLHTFFGRSNITGGMTGNAISDLGAGVNLSLIAFILQWVILLMIVIFAYSRFLKHKKEEEQKIIDYVIPKPKTKAETNIDFFLRLIREKGSLTIGTIAKAFSITKEQALDWAKILEEHGYVSLEYPAFSDPEVKIRKRRKEKKKGLEKTKEKKGENKEAKKPEEKEKHRFSLFKKKEEKIKQSPEPKEKKEVKPKAKKEEKNNQPTSNKSAPGEMNKDGLAKKLGEMDKYEPKK